MISFLKGIIADKGLNSVEIDVNGVGFEVMVSSFCYLKLGEIGEPITIQTYMHVREDEMSLYGFFDKFEKEVFLKLLLVNGVGPKMAINILSGVSAEDLSYAIATQNAGALKNIKGVGAKIRDRILLELKEKMDALSHLTATAITNTELNTSEAFNTALNVMIEWGVPKAHAQDILTKVYTSSDDMETLIAKAFRELGR